MQIRKFIVGLMLVVGVAIATPTSAQIVFIDSVAAGSGDGGSVTLPATDFSAANLLVAFYGESSGQSGTLSDSEGNTWTCLTMRDSGATVQGRLCYVLNPNTDASQTFVVSDSVAPCLSVAGFSGVASFDDDTGDVESSGSTDTVAPGAITPAADNALLVAGYTLGLGGFVSISGGFDDIEFAAFQDGLSWSCGMAYLIQGSAASANPTVTEDTFTPKAIAMASFLETVAAAGRGCSLATTGACE